MESDRWVRMKGSKWLLVFQICIGLLFGISLIKQEEYNDKLNQTAYASSLMKYANCEIKESEEINIFQNVNKQLINTKEEEHELLTKSKRKKILVTGDK